MKATSKPTRWNFEAGTLPYREQLFKSALRMTRSVDDAEDLLQETYLKAYKYYNRFSEGTNFKAWLFKIMKNTFINAYRRKKVQPYQVHIDDVREGVESTLADHAPGGSNDPEQELLSSEMDDKVRQALTSLPRDYKMVVLLADLGGFSYKETADILAVPVGAVMARLYRGRRMLERALLSFGTRYNYLRTAPTKLRDHGIEVGEFFGETAALQGNPT